MMITKKAGEQNKQHTYTLCVYLHAEITMRKWPVYLTEMCMKNGENWINKQRLPQTSRSAKSSFNRWMERRHGCLAPIRTHTHTHHETVLESCLWCERERMRWTFISCWATMKLKPANCRSDSTRKKTMWQQQQTENISHDTLRLPLNLKCTHDVNCGRQSAIMNACVLFCVFSLFSYSIYYHNNYCYCYCCRWCCQWW